MENVKALNEYLITGKRTTQVTEDSWERHVLNLKVTKETTVEQIVHWIETKQLDKGTIKLYFLENI